MLLRIDLRETNLLAMEDQMKMKILAIMVISWWVYQLAEYQKEDMAACEKHHSHDVCYQEINR